MLGRMVVHLDAGAGVSLDVSRVPAGLAAKGAKRAKVSASVPVLVFGCVALGVRECRIDDADEGRGAAFVFEA